MADGANLAMAAGRPGLAPSRWQAPLAVLLVVLAALGFVFAQEVTHAVHIWETSTAYNHCWLILPIAAWLAWQRRHRLATLTPEPFLPALLLMLPAALAWLLAERLGIMEGRQLTFIGMVWVAVLAVMGWRVTIAMAAPLIYLVFLVPFGAFTTPFLQDITAVMIDLLLDLTGIPHYVDHLIIEIPAGTFLVAEACAGLRFLIAALAFGGLYAIVMFRSPWRRLIVMVLAVVVPILANGLRAFGLVILGHFQGSAAAVAADHVLYGWIFFSIVILLLILAGLPFRQDHDGPGPVPAFAAGPGRRRPAVLTLAAGLGAWLFAAAGPAAAAALDRGTAPPESVAPELVVTDRCAAGPAPGTLVCEGATVTVRLLVFDGRANWASVAAERRRVFEGGDDVDFTFDIVGPNARWHVRQTADMDQIGAAAGWLGGQPAGDGVRSRARQAWNALRGGAEARPVVAKLAFRPAPGTGTARDRELFAQLLRVQEAGIARQAAALSAAAR
jgi:exosortase A